MRVLITGGAGYLGSVLTAHLLKNNYEVIVLDNLMYKQLSLLENCYNRNFTFILGDVRDNALLSEQLKNADVIIPLAAIVGAGASERCRRLTTEINFNQIFNIVNSTGASQQIIFPTTNSGYGSGRDDVFYRETDELNPISHYGRSKVLAETLLLDTGRAVTFRFATVFGISSRMRLDLLVNDFTYKAVSDKYLVLFEEHFKRNYLHVRDVAYTFLFAINNYKRMVGNTFNAGLSSANLSKMELAKVIRKHVGELSIQTDCIATDPDQRNYVVSNEKLEALGWKPTFTIDDGIQELIKAYSIILTNNNSKFTNL